MSQPKDCKFHVIQLVDPPYTEGDKYVCIPNTWVRFRETDDGEAVIKFPKEELSETKKRVRKEETYSEDWPIFLADIKYSSNSYKDANEYIKILNKISIQEHSTTILKEDIPSTSGTKTLELLPRLEKREVHIVPAIVNSNTELVSSPATAKQPQSTSLEEEPCQEKTKVVETTDSIVPTKRYFTKQAGKMSSLAEAVTSLDKTAIIPQEASISREESYYVTCNEENELAEKDSTAAHSAALAIKSLLFLKTLRSTFNDNFQEKLKMIHSNYEQIYTTLEIARLTILKNCKLLEQFMNITSQINNFDIDDLNEAIKKLENKIIEIDNNNDVITGLGRTNNDQTEKEEGRNNDDKNVTDRDEDKGPPFNKIRDTPRKFTLPAEYDPSDTKWTLKHREKEEGLVELAPFSGVYVDAIKLSHCKIISKDMKTFTRTLLLEVFSEKALSTCSLTGKRANTFDPEGVNVRPGLDEHALNVLMNYVEQYAIDQKWHKFNQNTIMTTIRNKMYEMRTKYG